MSLTRLIPRALRHHLFHLHGAGGNRIQLGGPSGQGGAFRRCHCHSLWVFLR